MDAGAAISLGGEQNPKNPSFIPLFFSQNSLIPEMQKI